MRSGNSKSSKLMEGHFGGAAAAFSFGGGGFGLAASFFASSFNSCAARRQSAAMAASRQSHVWMSSRFDAWRRADWSASDAALLAAPSRSPAPATPSMPSATVSVSSRSDAPSASSPGGSSSTVGVLAAASNTARIKPPRASI